MSLLKLWFHYESFPLKVALNADIICYKSGTFTFPYKLNTAPISIIMEH